MKLMKMTNPKILILIIFLITSCESLTDDNLVEEVHFEKEILRLKDNYSKNDNILSELTKDMDLYIPHFNFEQPEKYRKESFWKLYNGDKNLHNELPNDVYMIPEELIEDTENIYRKNQMERLIKKELNLEEFKLKDYHEVYGYPDANAHTVTIAKISDSLAQNIKIKNFSDISDMIAFEPTQLILQEKPILIPTMALIKIRNTMNEDMIINSVKSDLYQMTIFQFKPGKDSTQSFNQKNAFPKFVHSGEEIQFQIIILADMIGIIRGNIYFEIGKNMVVLYPVVIEAVENIYRVHPVYSPNWFGSKLLTIPLNIYNPHSKTLIIREVMNSFTSINLSWPNGDLVSTIDPSASTSMLEIPPKVNKNLMVINFYKETSASEYGLLQLKTDKDTLIIPVFIRVEIRNIMFYPDLINFGIIDLNHSMKIGIPLSISNVGSNPIELKMIYTNFQDQMIRFVPNLKSGYKCFKNINNENYSSSNESSNDGRIEKNICVINERETFENFGYLILDPKKHQIEDNFSRHIKGDILIQTNSVDNPFVELKFEYYIDRDLIQPINSIENLKKGTYVFEAPPESKNENYTFNFVLEFKLKHPFNISHNTISDLGYYYFYAQNNNFRNSKMSTFKNKLPKMEIYNIQDFTKLYLTFDDKLQEKISETQPFTRKTYIIPLPSTFDSIIMIPVKLLDDYVDVYCCSNRPYLNTFLNSNTINVYKRINKKNALVSVNLGMISSSETAVNYFILINDNDKDVRIYDVKTTNENLLIGIESVYDLESLEKIPNKTNEIIDNETLKTRLRKKYANRDYDRTQFTLPRNSVTVFSIIMNSYTEQEMIGTITITFKNSIRMYVNVNAKFLKGNLNISPSLIRFEPAFPGFYQHKFVSSKSSYNQTVTIHSVESNDKRIIPVLLTNKIIPNNRTEIIKVNFDPSKVSLGENFMKGDFLFNTTTRYLTFKEFYLWKEKQKLWELLGSQGRTEINTSINIKTSIQSETVQIRAFLTKPSLFKKDDIDFGLVQIGESASKFIEVYNPSDEVITIQVLLAPEEFSDIHNDKMFENNKKFNLKSNNYVTLFDCHFFNSNLGNPFITLNSTHSSMTPVNYRRKKKKEDIDGFDLNNSIILEENISNLYNFDTEGTGKGNLLKKIFYNSGVEVQNSLNYIKKIICNMNSLKKDEIILNRKELTDKLFSEEFSKEISIVKKMTDCPPPSYQKKLNETNSKLIEKIADFLKYLFKTEIPKKKNNVQIEEHKQEFYIPKIVSSQIYYVRPHQKIKIGPIIYHPTYLLNNTATLFIKNNLTILYPIKLKGNGGSGMLNFSLIETEFLNNGYLRKREIDISDNKLIYEIDPENEQEIITKTLRIRNTGNLDVFLNDISIENSGCESFGIKIDNCESVNLKPQESYKIKITLIPDFNFYFFEKEIIFSTQHGPVILKLSVNINNQLLSRKNSLFSYEHHKNFGYVSILAVVLVICVVFYFLTKEYEDITKTKINTNQTLSCLSYKDAIDTNEDVKLENMFIKAYRKYNHGFYDDFMIKQFDKPGTGNLELDTLTDKKKLSTKIYKEKKTEELSKPTREIPEIIDSYNNLESKQIVQKLDKLESTVKENKDKLVEIPAAASSKQIQFKKANENKIKKQNKKNISRPIGMPLNIKTSNDKKEESAISNLTESIHTNTTIHRKNTDTNTSSNATNIPASNIVSQTKQDSFNFSSNYNLSNNQYQKHVIKDECNNNTNYYNYYDSNNFDHSTYNNYWQKGFYNKQNPQRYDYNQQNNRYNYYNKQYDAYYNYNSFNSSNKSFNYFNNTGKYNDTIGLNTKINKHQSNISSYTESANVNNYKNNLPDVNREDNNINKNEFISNNINEKNTYDELNISDRDKQISAYGSSKSANNNREHIGDASHLNEKFDKQTFNEDKINSNKENLSQLNILEQYNSFRPDFYITKERETSKSDNKLVNVNRGDFINQSSDKLILQSFKNFDFSNIFNKPEKTIQDEYKNLNEEDASSHNYHSEKEKFDSGAEEFRFNFNSIFTQNNSNMKISENYNEYTDNEDVNKANKPYFDKSLLFSGFDWNKSQNGFFPSVNPFSTNTNKKLLDELREENNDEEENEESAKHKTDEIQDEDYDEEDPLWNVDPADIKEEGYFDVNGTYKLKQIDFNFDLDFKMKK